MNNMALPAILFAFIGRGLSMIIRAPFEVYKFFSGQAYFHWLTWIGLYFCMRGFWTIGIDIYRHGFSVLSLLFYCCAFGMAFCFFDGLAKKALKANGAFSPLAWVPGQGRFRTWIGRKAPVTASGSGAAKSDETLLRGAAVVDGQSLGAAMKSGIKPEDLAHNIDWGGIPIPYKSEPEHFVIEGKTGAGKTQAINKMLRVVRGRGQSSIIADPAGGYYARFGKAGEFILNPFDARTQHWSPFAEIEADYDCQRIAKAAIPDAVGESQEWHFYAQSLLGESMLAMHKAGENSIKKLLYYVNTAESSELGDLLAGTPAAILTKKGNDKMLSNTRAIASLYLSTWNYLKDQGSFSVRQWVRKSDLNQAWLYLTYRDDQMAMLRNLIACWLELAIIEGLSMSESQSRRLWYIMDELDSLGKISSLRAGLTKLRKYGGVIVAGLQTIAQLRSTYGHDEAQTLLSCMTTKLILKAGDGETAKYFENEIGQQEVERKETSEGSSQQIGNLASNSENNTVRRHVQSAVLASEIMGLENLHGFLMLTGLPISRIQLEYVAMSDLNPPFQAQ
jgi:hypothetical protein